jgi:hypothetical protein
VEGFHTKGWTKFFLLIFLIYGVKTMFSMILWDSRQFFDKIRPGQFLGQDLGYNILLTSRNEKYISKMVCDSDLQSLPVVSIFIRDILMTYPTPRLWQLPSCILKMAEVLKIKHVVKDLKILLRWRDWKFFGWKERTLADNSCHIPDTESHGEIFAGPSKLDFWYSFINTSTFTPLIQKLQI